MMVDYSKLSDFEINKAVALIVNPDLAAKDCYDISGRAVFHDKSGTCGFSFISDPADAWPIIDDNEISLIPSRHCSGWVAASDLSLSADSAYIDEILDNCFKHEDKNGLRAAMIVFLMMQDDKNG